MSTAEAVALPARAVAVDQRYPAVLLASLMVHAAGVGYLAIRPAARASDLTLADVPDRIRAAMLPALLPRAPPPPIPASRPLPRPAARPIPGRRAKASEAVKRALGWIGSDEGAPGGAIDELWRGTTSLGLHEALRGARDGREAAEVLSPQRRDEGPSGPETIDQPGTEGAKEVRLEDGPGRPQRRPVVREEPPIVEGGRCDRDAVARFVRQRLRPLQSCYERVLKRLPQLRGKITFRFVIGENGRAGEIEVDEDTLGNADVLRCMSNSIQLWVFPVRGSECPVIYPLVLEPAG